MAQFVTESRRWCIAQYLKERRRGNSPLQAMLNVYQEATATPTLSDFDSAMRDWRRFYAQRYFKIINLKSQGETLMAEYWKRGVMIDGSVRTS